MCQATAEDGFTACFNLENGMTSTLDSSCASAVDIAPQMLMFGSDGLVQLVHGKELVLLRPEQEPERFRADSDTNPVRAAQERWLEQVCQALRSGEQTGP